MNLDEFETQVKDIVESILNQLQTLSLLVPDQESKILGVGTSVQTLVGILETFIASQERD